MTLLYSDPLFLEHATGHHPERSERLHAIVRQLERTGLDQRCVRPTWAAATPERIGRVHAPDYLETLRRYAESGGGWIEEDTFVAPRSFEVAQSAAGAVCDAVERVVRGDQQSALCLVRPPGHHALPDGAMGFCLLGNVAIGARLATDELALDRVLIVDWDVHHGNGTQDIFWTDPRVAFFSIHRWPFYPGTGRAEETGTGDALGTIKNLPVEFGTRRGDYLKRFTYELERFANHIRPQLILVSAGFDAHRDDPVGSLGLETEDFAELTKVVLDIAATHCAGRLVSTLEGGYNTGVLAGCVELHLAELLQRDETSPSGNP
ncbi:MAG: histone deacetylase [Pirellulales bacterium]|nr:histone deacetylase [Pirellulales bacterium]